MKPTVDIAMFGSLLVTPLLFLVLPVRKALVTAYCMLWMFLPVAEIKLPGLPGLSKASAISVGVFIAVALFYADLVIKKYRPRWFDIPVVLFGVGIPFVSAMVNGLGMSGALYEAIQGLFLWVVPFFAGRILLGDEMGVEALATGIFMAALIYTPLAWFEMLMSPQLHRRLYGFHQHQFKQSIRGWSYRPRVFMQHGLMTSMWLVAGAMCGIWLYKFKRLKWNWPVPAKYAVGFLFFTAGVSNSMGAVLLMVFGLFMLFMTRKISPALVMTVLLLIPPVYIVSRATNAIPADELVELVRPVNSVRADSLAHRLYSEDLYVERAWEQPMLGWGGHGRHRPVYEETGKEVTSDGLWMIVFGKQGLIGLVCMVLALLAVPLMITLKQGARVWRDPRFAPASVLTVLLCIYAIDNLLNAMVNPIYSLAAGALGTYATVPLGSLLRRRRSTKQATAANKPQRQRPVSLAT